MSTQPLDYSAILADLEAKKAAIDATISSLRSALALGAIGQGGDVPVSAGASPVGLHNGEIPNGAFLGKSIPDAAKLYLEILKKKQNTREIAEALQRGGMESTSKNFLSIVHATLNRSRKTPNSPLVRIGSTWGLASWYPKGIISSNAPPSAKKKSKKAKKAKPASSAAASPIATKPAAATTEAPDKKELSGVGVREQMAALLRSKPHEEFSAEKLAEEFGQKVQVARMTLGQLVTKGVIQKTGAGAYRAATI